jgi:hypothetical protein
MPAVSHRALSVESFNARADAPHPRQSFLVLQPRPNDLKINAQKLIWRLNRRNPIRREKN